jgi:nucleoid-associated protein YgaU
MKTRRWLFVCLVALALVLVSCIITEVPSPTLDFPAAGFSTTDGELDLTGAGATGSVVQVVVDGVAVGVTRVGPSGAWSLRVPMAEPGQHEVRVQRLNTGGAVMAEAGPFSITVAPPVVEATPPSLNLPVGAKLDAGPLTLSGRGQAGTTLQVLVDGQVVGETRVSDEGAWSLRLSLTEPGDHQLELRTLDKAGNVAAEAAAVKVSLAAPVVEETTLSLDQPASADLKVGPLTLTGSGEPGSVVQVVADGQVVGMTQVGGDGTWSLKTYMIKPGEHQLKVQRLDASGVVVAEGEPISLSLAAPAVARTAPSFNLPAGADLKAGPLTLAGEGVPGSVVQVVVDGQVMAMTQVGEDGTWSLKVSIMDPGQHELRAQGLDASGAVVAEAEPVSISVAPAGLEGSAPLLLFPADGADIITGDIITGELTVIGSGAPDSEVEILDGSVTLGAVRVGTEGEWHFTFEPEIGLHRLAAHPLGDAQATSGAVQVRVAKPSDGIDCNSNPGIVRTGSYVVGTCDTLSGIARELGVGLGALEEANPQVENPDLIFPGQIVTIP